MGWPHLCAWLAILAAIQVRRRILKDAGATDVFWEDVAVAGLYTACMTYLYNA
jgi:hypothetical protein